MILSTIWISGTSMTFSTWSTRTLGTSTMRSTYSVSRSCSSYSTWGADWEGTCGGTALADRLCVDMGTVCIGATIGERLWEDMGTWAVEPNIVAPQKSADTDFPSTV